MACRGNAVDAFAKAWREWMQGIVFADHLDSLGHADDDGPPSTFEAHAVHYTRHPEDWAQVPLWRNPPAADPEPLDTAGPHPALGLDRLASGPRLRRAAQWLQSQRVRLYYRDLTPCDVAQAGLRVVRVLSPDLSQVHADERWPCLGGRVGDLAWRYPGVGRAPVGFPNPFPHPLG